ncbi:MATE family efflux transporter [Flavobacterium salilacus subsp. salilacus]|uniref:MATE family efflux transporter n=1 Tax=Flavobacterium TaxID=237 RepID=UPI00107570EB|nr:MATE family efflux transporter [Flavobacterium salilacus]KAF2519654.1 MATE family efflux transporter [Flavobacterium salilacus subsp. salilacus]MBE1614658.1 MATE family efflux transporter [Flavobacterium sp. SaA2.13]
MKLSAYTKEFRYNILLAWPVILGMLGHTITGIIDNIMVGKLGAAELAAASLGNSMVFIAMSVGIGFSTAITPIVAQYDAEKNVAKVRTVFHHGLFLCTILGVFLFAIVCFSKPLMHLMSQPEEVVTLAAPYIDWVAFSLLPMVIFQGYKQFADGLSLTKYAMYAVIISNVINIVVNYLLIYGIWIFPEMGIVGAALGTVISRIFMVVYIHYILAKNEQLKIYFTNFSFSEIKKSMLRRITALGIPSSMQMFFEVALFTMAVWLSGSIGKSSQAANQIALSLASMTFMFAMGLSVASMIRVGNQKGLKDYKKLLLVARSIFLLAVLLEIVFAALFIIFHNYLPQFFLNMTDDALLAENTVVINIAAQLLIVAAVFQISDGIQVVVLGALRGLQDVKIPTVITFISYWVIGFPISLYLGLYTSLEATGIWIGLLAGLTAAALFLYIRFNYLTKKLIRLGK